MNRQGRLYGAPILIFMKTKNIVFDLGNVLMKYDTDAMLDSFSLTAEEKKVFNEKIFLDPLWKDADKGYGYRDVLFYETLQGLPERLRKVFYALCASYDFEMSNMPVNQGIEKLLSMLKDRGYKLYLLSNIGLNFHVFSIRMPMFSLFDGMFASCDYGLIKPQGEIFEAFFERFSLIPEECLFIDDTLENVDASKKAGMDAICYNGIHSDASRLYELLRSKEIDI